MDRDRGDDPPLPGRNAAQASFRLKNSGMVGDTP